MPIFEDDEFFTKIKPKVASPKTLKGLAKSPREVRKPVIQSSSTLEFTYRANLR